MSVRILVAEDEALIRMDLVEMLQGAGYEIVAEATNGQEAVDLAILHKPDLVILDVKMPVMDGISAAEKIITLAPVLMLTAFSQKELIDRARDAGVMAYVVKPFSISDLIPAIEIAISRHLQMRSLAEEVADLHERLETRKLIDRAKGILMKALNLSEPEAFSWIQRAAMDRRLSMKQVAQAVISPDAVPDN
jgi:AmiR/NasT family two-component response regulator